MGPEFERGYYGISFEGFFILLNYLFGQLSVDLGERFGLSVGFGYDFLGLVQRSDELVI